MLCLSCPKGTKSGDTQSNGVSVLTIPLQKNVSPAFFEIPPPPSACLDSAYPGGVFNCTPMREEITRPFRPQYEANKKIILATQELCAICGQPVDKTLKSPDPMSATIDHIIPIAKGGHPSDMANLQLAHRMCNRAKGTNIKPDIPKSVIDPNRNLPQTLDWRTA